MNCVCSGMHDTVSFLHHSQVSQKVLTFGVSLGESQAEDPRVSEIMNLTKLATSIVSHKGQIVISFVRLKTVKYNAS